MQRKSIDVHDLVFANQLLEDPPVALQKATIDHDDLVGLLDPPGHAGMRNKERFGMTGASVRLLGRNQIAGQPGDFSADTRSFTGQNGDSCFLDLLLGPAFAGGTKPRHTMARSSLLRSLTWPQVEQRAVADHVDLLGESKTAVADRPVESLDGFEATIGERLV